MKYLLYPSHFIELCIILASVTISTLNVHEGYEVFAFQAVRGVNRLLNVIQVTTLRRQIYPWRLLLAVLYGHRQQLLLIVYFQLTLLATLSYACYVVEHQTNDGISNIFEAFIWGLETLSTTGYGNRVPQTSLGKLITSGYTLLSVLVFGLQGTVIGAGWALKAEQIERDNLLRIKKQKAAVVIQTAWRLHWSRRIYRALHNTFGFIYGVGSLELLQARKNEQLASMFIAKVTLHRATAEFQHLRRPLHITNIIEAQKFEKANAERKLKILTARIESFLDGVRRGRAEDELLEQLELRVRHTFERMLWCADVDDDDDRRTRWRRSVSTCN